MNVLANVDQANRDMETHSTARPVTVPAPHSWDGIGQALRAAYRNHRDPPNDIATVLSRLDRVD